MLSRALSVSSPWKSSLSVSSTPSISSPIVRIVRCGTTVRTSQSLCSSPLFPSGNVTKTTTEVSDFLPRTASFFTKKKKTRYRTEFSVRIFSESKAYFSTNGTEMKRFGVLQTGHASPYTENKYGDYGKMFIELLQDERGEGEEWKVFKVLEGEFPSDEDLDNYNGWVITGSRHDAHGTEEWIKKLCETLQELNERKKKILGVCFGHQVLSRALGGETGRSKVGWSVGLKEVVLNPSLEKKTYGKNLPRVIRILGVHQDQVSSVPPTGELLASSPSTPVEMFSVGEHVLGIQGHPEFRKDVIEDLVSTRLQSGIISLQKKHEKVWRVKITTN